TQMITELTGMTLVKLSGMVGQTILGSMASAAGIGAVRCTVNAQTGFPTPPDDTCYLQGFYTLSSPTFTSLSPASGLILGGTLVTLFGTFLDAGMTVEFDGVAATVQDVFNDGTVMTVLTPAHAVGVVDVEILTVDTLTNAYTYVSVLSVTPSSGTILGGTPVVIKGAGFTGATGVEFDGVAATDVVVVNDQRITAVTPAHAAGAVDVEVLVGIGTLVGGYTYAAPGRIKLPPVPVLSPVAQPDGGTFGGGAAGKPAGGRNGGGFGGAKQAPMQLEHLRWLMAVKQAIEEQSN